MKRQAPTDRELADLIGPACERLPEPDPRRLAAIELRLMIPPPETRRARLIWWWLGAALVAGTAGAWWWVVDYASKEAPAIAPPVQEAPAVPAPNPAPKPEPDAGEPAAKPHGPVIYQRERY